MMLMVMIHQYDRADGGAIENVQDFAVRFANNCVIVQPCAITSSIETISFHRKSGIRG
jgi:hypothetical protein